MADYSFKTLQDSLDTIDVDVTADDVDATINGEYTYDPDGSANTGTSYITEAMTSNTAPSPQVASADSEFDGTRQAWRVFDQTDTERWLSDSGLPHWVKIYLGSAKKVTKYRFKTSNNFNHNRCPGDWTLEGSNNDSDWDTLHTGSLEESPGQNTWTSYYTFTNNSSYSYYRMNITDTANGDSYVEFGELHLVEAHQSVQPTLYYLEHDTTTSVSGVLRDFDSHIYTLSGTITSVDNQLTTTSGDIVSQIPTDYVTTAQHTTTSGDIVDQIPSLSGYATESWVSSQEFATQTQLTTTSGDIVEQIPPALDCATCSGNDLHVDHAVVSTSGIFYEGIQVGSGTVYVNSDGFRLTDGTLLSTVTDVGTSSDQLTTTSGDIVSQIPSLDGYATESWVSSQNYIDTTQHTTTSGDIVDQIPSLTGYATESWVNSQNYIDETEMTTISGDLQTNIDAKSDTGHAHVESDINDLDRYTQAEVDSLISTTSGDLSSEIDSDVSTHAGSSDHDSRYYTETEIDNNFITISQHTTTSGDIVDQIPSLIGYATESWVTSNYVSQSQHTTTSGDIVDQIPSLTGYATEAWVSSQGYVTDSDLTTVSGDIVAQIPSDYVTSSQLTTTSGDIVTYVDQEIATVSGGGGDVTEEQLTTTSGDIITYVDNQIAGTTQSGCGCDSSQVTFTASYVADGSTNEGTSYATDDMTSDTTPGPNYCDASSMWDDNPTYGPWRAFDQTGGSTNDAWICKNKPSAGSPESISYHFDTPKCINKFAYQTRNIGIKFSPRDFSIQRPADGISSPDVSTDSHWTDLDSWSDVADPGTNGAWSSYFTFSNNIEYSAYRLRLTDGNYDSAEEIICIAELKLVEAEAIVSEVFGDSTIYVDEALTRLESHTTSTSGVIGTGVTWAGTGGATVNHNLGTTNHITYITPIGTNPGSWWLDKGADQDTVYSDTLSGTGTFDWSARLI